MTDEELKELYNKKIRGWTGWEDPGWSRDCLRAMRDAIGASTFSDAVEILSDDGWGDPKECAKTLRGSATCGACGGDGAIDVKRKS